MILQSSGGHREPVSALIPDRSALTCRRYVLTGRQVQRMGLIFPGQHAISDLLKLCRQSHRRQSRVYTEVLPCGYLPDLRSVPSGASEGEAGFLKIRM